MKMLKSVFELFLLVTCLAKTSTGQTSCSGSMGSSSERSSRSANSGDERFLVVSNMFTCHGQIERYEIYRRAPNCADFQFQIWRPIDVAGSRYMLLGTTDYVNSPACYYWNSSYHTHEVKTIDPMTIDEVPVQPGDVYGWSDSNPSSTTRTLSYDSAPSGSGTYDTIEILQTGSCTAGIGSECDWSSGTTVVRAYSVKLYLTTRQSPYFTNLPATTQMYEDSPVGSYVYRVNGWNHFSYSDVIDPDVKYSLVGGTCGYTKFGIDPVKGIINITSADALDHETHLSGSTSLCTLSVRVSEGPYTYTHDLSIDIQDVNEPHTVDNLPAQKVLDCAAVPNDFLVHDVSFSDVDTNRVTVFPAKSYRIEYSLPENPPFDIDANGEVRSSQSLSNWAGPTRFVLGITVADGTHSDGPHQLTIELGNLRTKPIVTNVDQTVSVPENSVAGGTRIFQVEGDSQPDSRGDPVTFHLIRIFPLDTAVDTFAIDQTSGWVAHKADPGFDYFGTRLYDLELEVRDSDNMYVSDPKNLSVEITWINKPPQITTVFSTTIDEKLPVLTPLPDVYLDGTDRDTPVGDWVDYQIYGTGSHLFWASNVTNRVYIIQEITVQPGQTQEVYSLQLLVYDSHGETDLTSLTVTVLDTNDNAPVFNPDYYEGSILETTEGGTYTGVTVTATDQDGGDNQQIDYFIIEKLGNLYFQVDSNGVITNKQPIAYAEYQNVTFTVVAADRGVPSLNDTAVVYIRIIEANTNEPYYDPDFYSLDLRSDTRIGTTVHVIPAQDKDSDSVQDLTFYWISVQDYFDLEPSTGVVSVGRQLVPFEKHLLYTFAEDNGSPTEHKSDPYWLRIDTYLAESTLVDIYLDMPLEQFMPTVDSFTAELDRTIDPWKIRLESYRLKDTSTVVRVYAIESILPDLKQNQDMTKVFIHKDKLLQILRRNLQGDPSDVLKEEQFASWKPYRVEPAYPVWITDTLEGVVLLSLLCLLALAAFITTLVLLSKKYRWGCYRHRPQVSKRRVYPREGDDKHFKLNYVTDSLTKPFFISDNKLLGDTYTGLFPPNVLDYLPVRTQTAETKLHKSDSVSAMRTSLHTPLNADRTLTPVQSPDTQISRRPAPVSRGGAAA